MMFSMSQAEKSLISVIVPAYNSEDTIVDALSSVATQTILRSKNLVNRGLWLELIVIDDASTDSTASVVAGMNLESDGKAISIKLLRQEKNSGPAGARNAGIAVANGEWLAFLDADDVWFPERLEYQWDWLKRNPDVGLVSARTRSQFPGAADSSRAVQAESVATAIELQDFVNGNWVATSTVLVRKRSVIAAGGFDSQFRGPEDYDLWIRIAASERVVRLEEPLAFHQSDMGGLSGDERTFLPEVLRVLDKAFGLGGCLHQFGKSKNVAIARQYWHASWMAFCRGARAQAIVHLLWAVVCGYRPYNQPWHTQIRLLVRYLFGSSDRMDRGGMEDES